MSPQVFWLLVTAVIGMATLMVSRPGGIMEMIGGSLAVASILAIPVGVALGTIPVPGQ